MNETKRKHDTTHIFATLLFTKHGDIEIYSTTTREKVGVFGEFSED